MTRKIDPVALTAKLIRCPTVTPEEGGALVLLEKHLSEAGFTCTRVDRNGTPNLYARWGDKGAAKTFGFNGHTDVVPVGDEAAWTYPPFSAHETDGKLWGRGATDMKSGVAAFVSAAVEAVAKKPNGAIALAITGDEEGGAADGTVALLDWMETQGEAMSVCLVGEPTCPETMGDMMKIGRRGSMNIWLTARGKQGHSAYPHRAANPLHPLVNLLSRLNSGPLDKGTEHFDPSTMVIVTVDTGNPATNVIPAQATATLNFRFNDAHTGSGLTGWVLEQIESVTEGTGVDIDLKVKISGESFVTPPGPLTDLVSNAVQAVTGQKPELSTSGGTSDARFMKNHCPVVEFGLVGKTMHQVDEHVEIEHIRQLTDVYDRILKDYFA